MFEVSGFRPNVLSFFTVGVMAVIFIILAKYLVNTYDNPITGLFKSSINSV